MVPHAGAASVRATRLEVPRNVAPVAPGRPGSHTLRTAPTNGRPPGGTSIESPIESVSQFCAENRGLYRIMVPRASRERIGSNYMRKN
jgi:hypothetical protein